MKYQLKINNDPNFLVTGNTLKDLSNVTNITQSTLYRIKSNKIAYKKNNGVGKFSNYQILIIPKN